MHCTKQSNTKQTGTMIGKGDGEKTSSTTGGGGGDGGSSAAQPPPAHPPKILLAKPGLVNVSPSIRGGSGGDDETTSLRSRLPSLNLLSDSSDFHFDRFLPFLTDNTEFTVVGVIGQPGVGKSTIMNEIYGFDPTSPGMLPPFATQSEEIRANARHCTVGIEPRISAERIILLDTQPVFTPSVLVDITRPDGSSTVPILGETLSAELAHELMGIQVGVLLASVCHILLVVAEGVHDANMWRLMSTVELLKHAIPDPSSTNIAHSQSSISGSDKEYWERFQEGAGEEYMAAPIFVHTKLRDEDFNSHTCKQMKKALARYFSSSSFTRTRLDSVSVVRRQGTPIDDMDTERLKLFLIPFKKKDEAALRAHHESYDSCLWRVGDQVLSMKHPIFKRTISEREWLKNTAKIWDLLKNSPLIAEYCKMLQNSGMFRK